MVIDDDTDFKSTEEAEAAKEFESVGENAESEKIAEDFVLKWKGKLNELDITMPQADYREHLNRLDKEAGEEAKGLDLSPSDRIKLVDIPLGAFCSELSLANFGAHEDKGRELLARSMRDLPKDKERWAKEAEFQKTVEEYIDKFISTESDKTVDDMIAKCYVKLKKTGDPGYQGGGIGRQGLVYSEAAHDWVRPGRETLVNYCIKFNTTELPKDE